MAPKKNKPNAFCYFMKEMQKEYAARGQIISMANMPNFANSKWRELSAQEKLKYEQMAKEFKTASCGKLASDGTNIEANAREEEEKELRKKKMIRDIKMHINAHARTEDEFKDYVCDKPFYFVAFNIACNIDNISCIPNEIGLVEYTINDGIKNEYTAMIDYGSIPNGYAGAAKLQSEIHKIDIYEKKNVVSLGTVVKNMLMFINPSGSDDFPPLFTPHADMERTMNCLVWLFQKSKCRFNPDMLKVWNSTYLLMELRAGVSAALPTFAIALELLEGTNFAYLPQTLCTFHLEEDCSKCALGYAKRLCYYLSDAICSAFGINPTPNHIPNMTSEIKQYTVTVPSFTTDFKPSYVPQKSAVRHGATTPNFQAPSRTVQSGYEIRQEEPPNEDEIELRQPRSTPLTVQMSRLGLRMQPAIAPGTGVGRGQRIIRH